MDEINSWDILSQLMQSGNQTGQMQNKTLSSIDKNLKEILNNLNKVSASNARNQIYNNPYNRNNQQKGYYNSKRSGLDSIFGSSFSRSSYGATKSIADAIEEGIMDGLLGEEFKKSMNSVRDKFRDTLEKDLGVPFEQVPQELGKALGKQIASIGKQKLKTKGLDIDAKFITPFKDKAQSTFSNIFNKYNELMQPNRGKVPNAANQSINRTSASSGTSMMDDISTVVSNEALSSAKAKAEEMTSGFVDASGIIEDAAGNLGNVFTDIAASGGTADAVLTALGGSVKDVGLDMVGTFIKADGAISGLVSGALQLGMILELIESAAGTLTSFLSLLGSLSKAANRDADARKRNLELAQKRLEADVKTMVEKPFEILNSAAQAWYDTWDQNLRTITATQGYNKSDLQDLMAAYADRLRSENLSAVVSASDISNNLAKVLEQGLSGKVAEEFAYEATKLNAAVPTQDFFTYAETYASIAANAHANGKSQADAIAYANTEIEKFASNVLYASRELSGGFSTGLKDAQALFTQSAQIAQASKIGTPSDIAGVMTAVSAVTGAIAPDLAQSMTDAIYKAATGGNSTEIVALRSLAGINASNTEFLKQLATDPQSVFTKLFAELAKRQQMAPDAFMEVAEGLSSVFGVPMDAFARIDFNYLASAIAGMNTTNSALAENMELLVSGETTTNAEMLKMQQINKYMIDEGLAYVLDNEAARAIQQHMWDEQLARQMAEATYGVEIQGKALSFLENLFSLVDNIVGFLIPVYGLTKLVGKGINGIINAVTSGNEGKEQEKRIKELVDLGRVGLGNNEAKAYLTNRNMEYHLIDSITGLMGGTKGLVTDNKLRWISNAFQAPSARLYRGANWAASALTEEAGIRMRSAAEARSEDSGVNSSYRWHFTNPEIAGFTNLIGKSVQAMLGGAGQYAQGSAVAGISTLAQNESIAKTTSEMAQERANQNVQKMVDSMKSFVDANKDSNYEAWVDTAKSFGIANFADAIEDAGLSEDMLRNQYTSLQTQIAAQEKLDREQREENFWTSSIDLLTDNNSFLESILDTSSQIHDVFKTYLSEWEDYFIRHTVYNSAYTHDTVDKILRAERDKSETAIYALADALTENDVKLLLDPTVQTNALLSQILKVVNALLNQQSSGVGGVSLAETIAGLSLGIVEQ